MDYYLKAPDEATMMKALEAAGIGGASVDIIGSITKVVDYDEKGEPILKEYPEFHVNLRGSVEDEAPLKELMIVPPETPFRVWA